MKPPQPKLPKTQTAQQQQESRLRELLSGQSLEALVLQRLQLPEQVVEFNRFEELSKLYEIEQPYVGRTQVELLFDVYDGRRLQQGLFGSLDDSEVPTAGSDQNHQEASNTEFAREAARVSGAASARGDSSVQAGELSQQHQLGGSTPSWSTDATRRRSNFAVAHLGRGSATHATNAGHSGGLSWCRQLFARRRKLAIDNRTSGHASGSPFKCCLRPSETNQDLGLVPLSTSGQSLAVRPNLVPSGAALSSVQAALSPATEDEPDESELKREALGVVSSVLAASTTRHSELAEPNLGPALALESAQMESTGGSVSVCLLDKRRLARDTSLALARAPVNGQRWARASARLLQLRRKLRNSSASSQLKFKCNSSSDQQQQQTNSRLIVKQLDRIARRVSRKFWSSLALDSLAAPQAHYEEEQDGKDESGPDSKRATMDDNRADSEQLIDLVKGSLNQLIDAQLLLRNKLTNSEQLTSSPIMNGIRSAEYENLLRNNFNLLKIWQNLEETNDGLVCFVCEPIRASLADLFWFNRRRVDWPHAQAFEAAHLNSNTTPTNAGPGGSVPLFAGPLVCLDASQVKRGLLQVSSALRCAAPVLAAHIATRASRLVAVTSSPARWQWRHVATLLNLYLVPPPLACPELLSS